jgi:peptide deformylase
VQVIFYPHPTLRYRAKPVRRVDRELQDTIRRMFELMYQHEGVGLAANQIDLPLQLFVVNAAGKPGEGQERVFINPVISSPKGRDEADEGCLSLPEIHAPVTRPSSVRITAYDATGQAIDEVVDGFLARVLQHEYDHLQGMLFIDRISPATLQQLRPELEAFELEFRAQQRAGQTPSDEEILERLKTYEQKYCATS